MRDSHRLAAAVAAVAGAGDVILLWGDVGAGKSEFARGFLRALCGRPELVVASPTYTLMMDYHHEALTSERTVRTQRARAQPVVECVIDS